MKGPVNQDLVNAMQKLMKIINLPIPLLGYFLDADKHEW